MALGRRALGVELELSQSGSVKEINELVGK